MDEFQDSYLGKIMKNWAGRRKAPEYTRRRILYRAAHPPYRLKSHDLYPPFKNQNYEPVNWEHLLLAWDIIHSYQNGLTVSRMVV